MGAVIGVTTHTMQKRIKYGKCNLKVVGKIQKVVVVFKTQPKNSHVLQ